MKEKRLRFYWRSASNHWWTPSVTRHETISRAHIRKTFQYRSERYIKIV